jgi:hypothetical protein
MESRIEPKPGLPLPRIRVHEAVRRGCDVIFVDQERRAPIIQETDTIEWRARVWRQLEVRAIAVQRRPCARPTGEQKGAGNGGTAKAAS